MLNKLVEYRTYIFSILFILNLIMSIWLIWWIGANDQSISLGVILFTIPILIAHFFLTAWGISEKGRYVSLFILSLVFVLFSSSLYFCINKF